jgi:uncharacterized protein YyaL (SSP411 family)
MLEGGEILQDQQYIQAAAKVADALLVRQQKDGALHGVYDQDWQPSVSWTCLTGNAQMSIIWLMLYQARGNEAYLEAIKKTNACPNWVAKFFLDALMLEERPTARPDAPSPAVGGNIGVAG